MNLVIDIGNTFLKTAVFNGKVIVEQQSVSKEDIVGKVIQLTLKFPVKNIIFSSVAETDEKLLNLLSGQFFVLQFNPKTPVPIRNKYTTPETLGTDRLAAAVGAHAYDPSADVLVVDAGTCLKFDFVNAAGEYLGGAISPGLTMRYRALHEYTARLPLIQPERDFNELIGNNSEKSIKSGVQTGMLAEIEKTIEYYREKYVSLKVLLTGGDAPFFEKKVKSTIFAVPDLVLQGLNEILNYNAQK